MQNNPRNPFALQAMAVARMLAGDGEEAYRMSLLGRSYASRSAFRHWWDAHHATICIATGRTTEAIQAAEVCALLGAFAASGLPVPHVAYAQRGDLNRANAMREELERLGTRLQPGPHAARPRLSRAHPAHTPAC